ncbi:hypothetical protein DQ04_05581040 [Trypanosoma grayi]|uniref:hypothetical protein n=1 Tax=Trypanosoma grayi TaxID=71804 RepID=UPI0004F46443|nr:hypothetical protein DQ04_05581040 [Trypanosoma grayi]KEG09224.1 hypothetical protein DQ04_05581040 [Trypanosoma grayi]
MLDVLHVQIKVHGSVHGVVEAVIRPPALAQVEKLRTVDFMPRGSVPHDVRATSRSKVLHHLLAQRRLRERELRRLDQRGVHVAGLLCLREQSHRAQILHSTPELVLAHRPLVLGVSKVRLCHLKRRGILPGGNMSVHEGLEGALPAHEPPHRERHVALLVSTALRFDKPWRAAAQTLLYAHVQDLHPRHVQHERHQFFLE